VWQGGIYSILVKIHIQICVWIQYFFEVILHHWEMGPIWYIARHLKKLWMDYDKTWWMSWVGDKNKPIRFGLRSGCRSSNLWETKRKLFILAVVRARLHVVLIVNWNNFTGPHHCSHESVEFFNLFTSWLICSFGKIIPSEFEFWPKSQFAQTVQVSSKSIQLFEFNHSDKSIQQKIQLFEIFCSQIDRRTGVKT